MHRRAERYRFLSQHTEHGCGTAQAGVAQDQIFLRIDRQLCVMKKLNEKGYRVTLHSNGGHIDDTNGKILGEIVVSAGLCA